MSQHTAHTIGSRDGGHLGGVPQQCQVLYFLAYHAFPKEDPHLAWGGKGEQK